jgi:S-(hydroxymethyl)mycothiol dehydrogenase
MESSMAITGRGIVARGADVPLVVEELVIDSPGAGEVLVKILASGVCHTDLHIVNRFASNEQPFLLGHEGTGVVVEVGPGVTTPKVDDKVILAWRAPCGKCRFCLIGQPHLCASSLNAERRMHTRDGQTPQPALGIGTFCTHTVVAAGQAIPIPSSAPAAQTCLIGCGVMTGVGAVMYSANVRPGSTVAVFGCGGVGANVIQGARIANARKIIAVDLADNKLEWAKTFGATDTVNPKNGDVVEQIKKLTDGHGVDYSFECIGLPNTLLQALLSRDLAGTCVLIGVPGAGPVLDLPMQAFFDIGGSLRVSWYGDCLPSRDFPMLTDWYTKGVLQLDELVTREIGLDEVGEAFHAMERGETLRSVIVFPEN